MAWMLRAQIEADAVSFNAAISAAEKGRAWQWAVALLEFLDQILAQFSQQGMRNGMTRAHPMVSFDKMPRFLILDCYWVGSLDFNFLGNQGFSTKPANS